MQRGLQLAEESSFYAVSKKLPTRITNDGKPLVVSFQLLHRGRFTCGGGYIKLLPAMDQKDFHGETEYGLMFGPDICGGERRVHIIFNYKGQNYLWNKRELFVVDELTHAYTLAIYPNNTYALYLDANLTVSGSIAEEWSMLPPEMIDDPSDKKPAHWDDEPAMIPDPDDTKPEDWDKEPATILDPDATKPNDWNDAEDGEWEPPIITNPNYKGDWFPRKIKNPKYKGQWKPRQIKNPNFYPDPDLYRMKKPLEYVGIDVWTVEAGSIYTHIMIGDNVEEVLDVLKTTFVNINKLEARLEKAEREKMEREREEKALEEAEKDETAAAAEDDEDLGDEDEENTDL
ncbi:calreticulin [Strigomonas culicis]|nr:calreticulin [Strigomonas culicis]|eukprot:EPY31781.1 calreticulin [Strigomonas culicis]